MIKQGLTGLRGIALAIGCLGTGLVFVPSLHEVGAVCWVLALGVLILSIWPERTDFEMRELAVIIHSDLSHVDSGHGPTIVDYDWISDMRWDEENRLVLALTEPGTMMTMLRFARTAVPDESRRDISTILWQRIGKSRRTLAAVSSP